MPAVLSDFLMLCMQLFLYTKRERERTREGVVEEMEEREGRRKGRGKEKGGREGGGGNPPGCAVTRAGASTTPPG